MLITESSLVFCFLFSCFDSLHFYSLTLNTCYKMFVVIFDNACNLQSNRIVIGLYYVTKGTTLTL